MKTIFKTGLLAATVLTATSVYGDPSSDANFSSCNSGVCTITGTIDQDYTMVAGTDYVLSGTVKVGDGNGVISSASEMSAIQAAGVTLTVEPGVNVYGASDGVLLVTRGSKLVANGNASNPITFSSLDLDYDGMGEWGGIVIQGFAPQYGAGNTGACFAAGEAWCNVEGEGGTTIANYGGNLPADNSGVIRYVRIAEGGLVAGPNNEVNGLTLQGVGHGTQIEYVQVHGNLDDGIEWFGGTANVTHAVLTNNDDDDIDFDEGFQGNIQYALVIKRQDEGAVPVGSNDPRGLELNSSDDDYVPQTAGSIANVTVIGGDAANSKSEFGMRIRGSVTANIYNSAVTGYDNTCARIDDSDHDGSSATAKIDTPATFTNFICDTAGTPFLKEDPTVASSGIVLEGISLDANLAITNASASVAATTITAVDNGSGFVFDSTDYVGAVKAGETPWYEGWTLPGTVVANLSNDYDSDNVDNSVDAFPYDPTESVDTDNDGIGNNADTDDDGDGVADVEDSDPLNPSIGSLEKQEVVVVGNPSAILGSSLDVSFEYNTSNNNASLTGLGLRVHYDSSVLTFVEFADVLNVDSIANNGPFNDIDDLDNDSVTDKYLLASWASINGNWPGTLPSSLLTLTFNVVEETLNESTPIGLSISSLAAGYGFTGDSYDISIVAGSWDFDEDGTADALTDGLVLLRYLFGLRGAPLTSGAIATSSSLSASEVEANIVKSTTSLFADIDGNGEVDALTDGLVLLRYLFGLRGDPLIAGAVGGGAERTTVADIEAYIVSLMP